MGSPLDEAAAWLRSRDVTQWPARFDPAWIAPSIAAGETWLFGDRATVTLDVADPLWDDGRAAAAYVHRLTVRRAAAGLGAQALGWCEEQACGAGCEWLRLDCLASNSALRA